MTSPFLIVEDDLSIVRVLRRVLSAYGEVRSVTSIAAALDAMSLHRAWCGLVLDFNLGDGNGLDFLELARTRYPYVPALLVTGTLEPRVVNRAFQLGAGYLCKPVEVELLRRFARDARGAQGLTPAEDGEEALPRSVRAAVAEYGDTYRLSPTERILVEAIAMGIHPRDVMQQRDITQNTYKSHVRHILEKTGEPTVGDVRAKVMQLVVSRA